MVFAHNDATRLCAIASKPGSGPIVEIKLFFKMILMYTTKQPRFRKKGVVGYSSIDFTWRFILYYRFK
jgi:hypothetical protein